MVEQSIANQQQNQSQIKKDFKTSSSEEGSSNSSSSQEDLSYIDRICKELRDNFYNQKVKTESYEWRMEQLGQLKKMIEENKQEFGDALAADLGSSSIMKTIEVEGSLEEISGVMDNLKSWMQPDEKSLQLIVHKPGHAKIVREPYGLVLVVAPWNYPVELLVKPVAGAIAAGNCVVFRPSSNTSHVEKVFDKLTPKYMDQNAIRCIIGPSDTVGEQLLKQRFDYIFYTGSTRVGKKVMKAAAEHLTPVTLELGGKSPVYIDKNCDLNVACRRLIFGKCLNASQTCVSPDYVLCHKDIYDAFLSKILDTIHSFYGDDMKQSNDFGRIISKKRMKQLVEYLEEIPKDHIVYGGDYDMDEKYFSLTLVKDPNTNWKIMEEEIFGPILPILKIEDASEAIAFIKDRPKPLALYVFTSDEAIKKKFVEESSSGDISINETILHVAVPDIPFGGVGESGMGSYNAKRTYLTFSHEKGFYEHSTLIDPDVRYPPSSEWKQRIMKASFNPIGFKALTSLFKSSRL